MANPLDPNDLVTLEALTIANMWEVACARGAVDTTEEVKPLEE